MKKNDEYIKLNAKAKMFWEQSEINFDLEAARNYWTNEIKPKVKKFNSFKEKIDFLIENDYYEKEIFSKFDFEQVEKLNNLAQSYKHEFASFMGILKFYNSYALKTFDSKYYLETFEDRVLMNVLFLSNGDFNLAKNLLNDIMMGRFQPATPTFLNAGKKQRGEYISCYLIRTEDNMESISRSISTSLQLSKRGGGVSVLLTNLRELGAPIKKIENQATGIIPVMKLLEDSFSYANQLGQRQGAGAVYLNVHHPDILQFLDSKRENADEKIRIKSLSLGVVIPDITFELAKKNEQMALFSSYDIFNEYKKPMSDISITKEYYNLLNNPKIKKTFISARKLFSLIAELHFESGYPFILFDDTVNNRNAHPGRIVMSNLCSEIAQVSNASEYNVDLSYKKIGEDICCNLGSLNIAKAMEAGNNFEALIYNSILALDHVSRNSNLDSAPSIKKSNNENHALGLGAMNLHGFLANNQIFYDSIEAIEFTNLFFYSVAFYAFKASNKLALKYGKFKNFEFSKFSDGSYFDKYTKNLVDEYKPKTEKIKTLFKKYNFNIPSQKDWIELVEKIKKDGLANSHLMAIAPTGSISYLTSSTPSLQPVVAPVETRKEGKLGRVYVPAYNINFSNMEYYVKGAYELGPNPIIDIAAAAQKHVDQAISLTLFFNSTATTRDLNKAYIYAFKNKCSSIYYVRVRQDVLENSETYDISECDACKI
ncbi:class 1b ribonucleoside-diphosphate reductase subunit alpha [[Mycoplasma] collis]|uniref:class 1b ribonucleoside-diphosphate reductase subunit alpha n=1 Tax=[Mycoplasma] collis TaxID=2127 RepID=UPI00051B0F9E|nr:class 1b ribonucleoside-diphosphate reductase subunit alpha [[Mycoplasma] collis]